jgi:hypothetical protein
VSARRGAPSVAGWRTLSSEDVLWYERARQFEVEALPRVRESAQRWAATLAAITGVFGVATLVKGPTDLTKISDPTWANRAAFSVIIALLLAAAATYCAYRAQGLPTRAPVGEVAKFRNKYRSEIQHAAWWLLGSQVAAVATVILVALSVAITWSGTPRPFETLDVIAVDDGGVHCGKVVASSSSWLAIKVAPTSSNPGRLEIVPTGKLTAPAAGTNCP